MFCGCHHDMVTMDATLENNENYVLPRCRLRISKQSFIPSTVRMWNDLSPTIRNLQTISQFKLKIKGEQFRPPV
jgi:hypothetical protein